MPTTNIKAQPLDDRRSQRCEVAFAIAVESGPGQMQPTIVHNVSAHGALIDSNDYLVPGRTVTLEGVAIGCLAARVAWTREGYAGLAFLTPLTVLQLDGLLQR